MMNVKKYRATTTREALEQIKQDLGEDAFVLETKQVKTGGFLGFKSGTQIEISAAAPMYAEQKAAKAPAKGFVPAPQILNLKDDTLAVPAKSADQPTGDEKKNIMSALNSRHALSQNFESAVAFTPEAFKKAPAKKVIEAVEISSEAPRFVRPKKDVLKQAAPAPKALTADVLTPETITSEISAPEVTAAPAAIANPPAMISSHEFELLRAELREVKFSLNAFASRQIIPTAPKSSNLEEFGEVFDSPFYDAYLELAGTGISSKIARRLIADIIPDFKNGSVKAGELAHTALVRALSSQIRFEANPLEQENPTVMAIIGATGVGKTTTIAKLAARLVLHERRRVELVTLDTYRIAAVEQLKTYAEIIGAGCQVVRSVFELDAVLRRLPSDVTVLIDTTGKNPHDLADQYELSDYLLQHPEIRKCLAVQATIHPLDGIAAIKKFEMYGADCLALTKLDETTRPGAMIELVAESNLPLAYCCMGQRVPEDLHSATPESFAARILRQNSK